MNIGEEKVIPKVFFPEAGLNKEGYLVGYTVEDYIYVVSAIVPFNKVESAQALR